MNIYRKPFCPFVSSLIRQTTPISQRPLPRPSNIPSSRTLFGWGRRKQEPSETAGYENPVYEEYLKKKPPPPPTPVPGDLAGGSIFETEDARSDTGIAPIPKAPGARRRNPTTMAAAVDPQPHVRERWERKMVIRDIRRRGRLSRRQKIKATERESLSKSHMLKTSLKKLGPLARQIAGKTVEDAIVQMRFSKKKVAKEVKEHLEHARNQAVVRRGMGLGEVDGTKGDPVVIETDKGKKRVVTDRTGIYIDQAWVGRGSYGKEPEYRARGRMNLLRPPTTSITVLLKEEATRIRQYEDRERKRQNRKVWVQLSNRPIIAQRSHYCW